MDGLSEMKLMVPGPLDQLIRAQAAVQGMAPLDYAVRLLREAAEARAGVLEREMRAR
jgi:hypothetical protein